MPDTQIPAAQIPESNLPASRDRLYELLPVIYRQRDAEQGFPLRALLRVINRELDVVEQDIGQLYENWFIETAANWALPYIGDLIGYQSSFNAGQPVAINDRHLNAHKQILIPRRDVANTIGNRRRKGTLSLLENLARDVAGWPARAVEFYRDTGVTQNINHLRLQNARTAELRDSEALDKINGPFNSFTHNVDVRRSISKHTAGAYNIPDAGVYVWRLKPYPITQSPAYCLEDIDSHFFSFSVLGNDMPLYSRPARRENATSIAGELDLPIAIRRHALQRHLADYYGLGKSFYITEGEQRTPVTLNRIVVADLTDWKYRPKGEQVAVDPILGRIIFSHDHAPRNGLWVNYYYGFSDELGGGEYTRQLSQPETCSFYSVGEQAQHHTILEALKQWQTEKPQHAVIEISQSNVYVEQLNIRLAQDQTLQIRAADKVRPVIRLLDWQTAAPDSLWISGEQGSRLTLDGLLITGRGVQLEGDLQSVHIRHCTLVPGWALTPECRAQRPNEPALDIHTSQSCIEIQHSILGALHVHHNEVRYEPLKINISDSIIDASSAQQVAIATPGRPVAHALLNLIRCTVHGQIQSHAIELAENSIITGTVKVARRQTGCMRFCYVHPDSRSPRRYRCQPQLAEQLLETKIRSANNNNLSAADLVSTIQQETQQLRITLQPQFTGLHYGTPGYCQLATNCAIEISQGADDESEMGVFHNLFQAQRTANLRARLDEYTPAAMTTGIFFAS